MSEAEKPAEGEELKRIPIKIDGVLLAEVGVGGDITLGDISGPALFEMLRKYNDLAAVDPAIFMLISTVLTQNAVIARLSREVLDLKAKVGT